MFCSQERFIKLDLLALFLLVVQQRVLSVSTHGLLGCIVLSPGPTYIPTISLIGRECSV